ncbi:MAG TPA: tail fiber protein [Nitrosopumilaceae archaeon]|nr:tail fiber protein [Nitrosopumilaceae archaeon]
MKKITSILIISAIALVFLIPPPNQAFACGSTPFVGEMCFVGFNFAPQGYAFCNGQLLAISQNTALFSLLGTTYGGNGITTFALPDMQGRVPVGFGQGNGLSPINLGQTGGEETHTLTVSQLPAHSPTLYASTAQANTNDPTGHVLARAWPQMYSTLTNNMVPMNAASSGIIGGNQPFNVRDPYLGVNCIIALNGIFPSRN